MRQLKAICAERIGSQLTIESVSDVLILADMHSTQELRDNAIEFIRNNVKEVMDTNGWKRVSKNNVLFNECISVLVSGLDLNLKGN